MTDSRNTAEIASDYMWNQTDELHPDDRVEFVRKRFGGEFRPGDPQVIEFPDGSAVHMDLRLGGRWSPIVRCY